MKNSVEAVLNSAKTIVIGYVNPEFEYTLIDWSPIIM